MKTLYTKIPLVLISLTLSMFISVPNANSANHIEMYVSGCYVDPPDSAGITNNIAITTPVTFKMIITNDVPLNGASLGLRFYSPDASITTITHDTIVTHEPWGHVGFDGGGALFNLKSWDGSLPDSVCFGGVAISSAFPVSSLFNFLDFKITTSAEIGILCVDTTFVPPACEWLLTEKNNPAAIMPTWGGGAGDGYCFKTFAPSGNAPCVFTNASSMPSIEIASVCGVPGSASYDFDASDIDGPGPCVFSMVSGLGSIDSISGLYEFTAPSDTAGNYVVRVRVEDQLGAGCEHQFQIKALAGGPPSEDDSTTSLGAFRILVHEDFRGLMDAYPGYDGLDRLTSSTLYDPATRIGRSGFHLDGDGCDNGGTAVGVDGTVIADSDFTLTPEGFEGPPGTLETHTEIRDLNMEDRFGMGVAVRAGTHAPGRPLSPGEIESHDTGGSPPIFPAQSFFNVFVEVDLPAGGNFPFPGGTLINQVPILVESDTINSFPPKVVYTHENPEAVKIYFRDNGPGGAWLAGDLFGWLVLAGHGVDFDTVTSSLSAGTGAVLSDLDLFEAFIDSIPETCCLVAGDADAGGDVNIGDATFLVKFIFQSGDAPPCKDQADADGSNDLNIGDATFIVKFIFQSGATPKCGTTKT